MDSIGLVVNMYRKPHSNREVEQSARDAAIFEYAEVMGVDPASVLPNESPIPTVDQLKAMSPTIQARWKNSRTIPFSNSNDPNPHYGS